MTYVRRDRGRANEMRAVPKCDLGSTGNMVYGQRPAPIHSRVHRTLVPLTELLLTLPKPEKLEGFHSWSGM